MSRPLICLMGPTGVGKTALAVALAARVPVQIVSVDSAMVYRGLDIGTAKPDRATLARAPHALIDLIDPTEAYSAARFAREARAVLEGVWRAGGLPLLVGGTGLYFRALLDGLSDVPPADLGVRAALEARLAAEGQPALHAELARCDPDAARRIHAHDTQRTLRALEVWLATGQHWSALLGGRQGLRDVAVTRIVVAPADRALLRQRLALRWQEMLERGLLGEVQAARERHALDARSPGMRLVGYREAFACLEGRLDAALLPTAGARATVQLAKRQMTWFRREADAQWFADDDAALMDRALQCCASASMLCRVEQPA